MAEKYNGWTNYETWLVILWLDNGGSGEHWREQAETWLDEERDDRDAETLRQHVRDMIADQIESEHNDMVAEIIPSGSGPLWDMLSASLRRVNWREIAEHYVDDVPLYAAGWNMPGYMPDAAPALFVDHDDAVNYIKDEIGRYAEEDDSNARDADCATAIDVVDQTKGDADVSVTCGDYVYWVTKV